MRKELVMIMLFTCACMNIQAQVNYVRNGSFEQHWRCPVTLDQVTFANNWTTIDTINVRPELGDTFSVPNCSPEYINICASGNYIVGAPENGRFYQYPRTGNGMMQVQMYFDESLSLYNKRDYLQGRFFIPLIAGRIYCITFYANFQGNGASVPSGYAVDHIGAYIDNGAICQDTGMNYCGLPKPWITPQVYTTAIITDTVNWTKIQGSFVANGTEKFITIGNFFDNAHTNYIAYPGGTEFSWYLVDDVSVIESTEVADAGPDVGVVYGDSVHIGTGEEGMPCTWYAGEGTTPIGYGGGIWVSPNTTRTYVVEMDLCGNVTRDTVKVTVWPVGTPFDKLRMTEPVIWPNPVSNELHVDNGAGSVLSIYDAVGRAQFTKVLHTDNEVVNISHLPGGIYIVCIADRETGFRTTKKIVKE